MKVIHFIIFTLLIMSFSGCKEDPPGILPVEPTPIPDALAGNAGAGARSISRAALQDEFYPEYSNFYIVPQLALNYNIPQADIVREITNLANDPDTEWTNISTDEGFTKSFFIDYAEGVLRTNDDYSDWEFVAVYASGLRRHLRTTQKNGYIHSRLLIQQASLDTPEALEIIETDDTIYIRSMRVRDADGDPNGYYDPDSAGGTVYFDQFAAITKKDGFERTLGMKMYEHSNITSPIADDPYSPDNTSNGGVDARMVGAFDIEQLMIRPDTLTSPLELYISSNPGFTPEDTAYPSTQGESFDSSLFPGVSQVEKLFDLGITPEFAAKARIADDYTVNYTFPDWSPSDLNL